MLEIEHSKKHLHQNPQKRARGRCMGKHLVCTLKRGLSFCRRTFEGLTVQRSVEKGAVVQLHFPLFKGLPSQTGTHYQFFLSFYMDEIGKNISTGTNGENNAVFQESKKDNNGQ